MKPILNIHPSIKLPDGCEFGDGCKVTLCEGVTLSAPIKVNAGSVVEVLEPVDISGTIFAGNYVKIGSYITSNFKQLKAIQ